MKFPYRDNAVPPPPEKSEREVITREFDLCDVTGRITWQDNVGHVRQDTLEFLGARAEKVGFPLDRVFPLTRHDDTQLDKLRGGDKEFRGFVFRAMTRGVLEVGNDLFIPWHRVFSCDIVARKERKVVLQWYWV